MLYTIFNGISVVVHVVRIILIVYCVLTWVAPQSALRYRLQGFIAPLCSPFRRLSEMCMRKWGAMFDLTILFTLIGLSIAERLLWVLYSIIV